MKVAVVVDGEAESRCASALLAHPRVELVGLVGVNPPASWGHRATRTEDGSGFDIVVGPGAAASLARSAGAVLVVTGPPPDDGPTVSFAGPEGLARALAAGLDEGASVALTIPGAPVRGGERVAFPAPLGWVMATRETGSDIFVAPVEGPLAAVAAFDRRRIRAVLDDRLFLAGACLAAGALAARGTRGPVWTRPDPYLAAVEDLGLVIAESLSRRE